MFLAIMRNLCLYLLLLLVSVGIIISVLGKFAVLFIGKVFDWVILILNSSKLQIGFKPDTSTAQRTLVMNETI